MTTITAVVFLFISRYWFFKILQKPYGLITRAATFYFAAMLVIHTPAPILLLMGKLHYQIGFVQNLVSDLYLSSTIIIFFYHMIEAFLLVIFVCILKKWYWKAAPFLISIVAQSIFAKTNVLILKNGWTLTYTLLIYELSIAAIILIEEYTLKPDLKNIVQECP